jgi:hypothetical protein
MSRVESKVTCPNCRSPVEEHLEFCHSCGETMHTDAPSAPKKRLPAFILPAAAILALAFAVIMGITIYDFVRQYGVPGAADVTARAEHYMSQGREENAINLLEESIQVKGSDQRAGDWRRLLDQGLFSLGKKLASEGKFRDAVTAFARISADFAKHEEVEKLIAEYSDRGLPSAFSKSEESEPALEKEKKPLSKLEKAVMTAVPGGKQHVDPMPSSIRPPEIAPLVLDQATRP